MRIHNALLLVAGLALAGPALANPLPPPSGPVVLTIDGSIAHSNADGGDANFDLAMLEALPAKEIETTTPWTDGKQNFVGVELAELLKHVGAAGTRGHAIASNAYEVTFALEDVTAHGGIVAYRQNGTALPADKGPLWIVFPYDSDPMLLGDRFQSASIWNLVALSIR
ncbi:molybdopterin-dependent oxidoreductase [Dongia sp.]|uniref:molybdopterin-dependent oxidoreductase n=1 Tax=Dongia sp. TaxID=1977262 RepID=UPI0035B0E047